LAGMFILALVCKFMAVLGDVILVLKEK
jgi:hypothetical protein